MAWVKRNQQKLRILWKFCFCHHWVPHCYYLHAQSLQEIAALLPVSFLIFAIARHNPCIYTASLNKHFIPQESVQFNWKTCNYTLTAIVLVWCWCWSPSQKKIFDLQMYYRVYQRFLKPGQTKQLSASMNALLKWELFQNMMATLFLENNARKNTLNLFEFMGKISFYNHSKPPIRSHQPTMGPTCQNISPSQAYRWSRVHPTSCISRLASRSCAKDFNNRLCFNERWNPVGKTGWLTVNFHEVPMNHRVLSIWSGATVCLKCGGFDDLLTRWVIVVGVCMHCV